VKILRTVLLVVGVALAATASWLWRDLRLTPERLLQQSGNAAQAGAAAARQRVEARLQTLATAGLQLATDLGEDTPSAAWLQNRLREVLQENGRWRQAGYAFQPDVYPGRRLYGPYTDRGDGTIESGELDYDYTLPDDESPRRTAWYHRALSEGPGWSEPYTGSLGVAYAEFTTPVPPPPVDARGRARGVAWLNFDLHGLRQLVADAVGEGSYGIIYTDRGTIVSHPTEAYLGRNVSELGDGQAWIIRRLLGRTAEATSTEAERFVNDRSGVVHWVVRERLSNGWWLAVGFDERRILGVDRDEMRERTSVRLAALGALLFLGLGAAAGGGAPERRMWVASIFGALVMSAAVAAIWHLSYTVPHQPDFEHDLVLDAIGLEAALMPLDATEPDRDPVRVPTGVFVQQIEFASAYDVRLSGYVWQRLPAGGTAEDPGVVFPEAVDVELIPAFDRAGTVGWHFTATLRQPFHYNRYPFDREYVWLRLWHRDEFGDHVLVPDLPSYPVLRPEVLPGVEADMVLEGWLAIGAFFGYRDNTYTTDFGGVARFPDGGRPELYYNIAIKRDFLAFFVSDMITLIIVSVLLFAVLMISTSHGQLADRYGFSSATVLAYCASLFFVLIVSHVHLRQKLAAEGVIYLEGFYFVLYGAILLVSVASILFVSKVRWSWLHWRDGLAFKLAYWPLISAAMLAFTWWEFF
jgi:hypothetical protein